MALPKIKNFEDYDQYITEPDYTTSAQAQEYFKNQRDLLGAVIVNYWQPETTYPNGYIVQSDSMPNGTEAVCVAVSGGKTGNVEPEWGEIGGSNISDGTCFWHLRHKVATVNGLEPDNKGNIQIPVMTGSNGNNVGKDGLVPAPPVTEEEKFLSNDGTWKEAGKVKSVNGKTGDVEVDTLPIGFILPYGGSTAPAGWLACNGAAVSRATYASLFSAIGTKYGAGDGSATFNLPNMGSNVISEVSTGNLAVKGNGKALGLTNGTTNYGIAPSSPSETNKSMMRVFTTYYGANVGTSDGSVASVGTAKGAAGITTDGSKSGMVVPVTATKTTVKYCIKY